MLSPFVHLPEDLVSPLCALELLRQVEAKLKENVFGYPSSFWPGTKPSFGWYKTFKSRASLAVLSRFIPKKANPALLRS
jgi:hypothetical protein